MKTTLVLVTYNPDKESLLRLISSIEQQVSEIVIVDNTPGRCELLETISTGKIEIIYLKSNMGIAYAQNVGIQRSLEKSADYIMLSDQDTVYPVNYIKDMLEVFKTAENIAAVAPAFLDKNKKSRDGFISLTPLIFKSFFPQSGFHEVMQVISSGKILKAEHLKKTGLMDESLFIDWVDLEWCWRAGKKGFKIIGNADVVIQHQLGDSSRNIGFREVNIRSPLRHYYITRNAFHLALRDKSLDRPHRVTLFLKSFRYIVGYPILSKPHLMHLRYVLLGFWHGIRGRLGKLDDTN